MYCCGRCFSDRYLKSHIEKYSTIQGDCSFCGSTGVSLIEPESLLEKFQTVIELYYQSDNNTGKLIYNHLQDDWQIFAHRMRSPSKRALVNNILGDLIEIDSRYLPTTEPGGDNIDRWGKFQDELKFQNRYFPNITVVSDTLKYIFTLLLQQPQEEMPTFLYRSRINRRNAHYTTAEMGRPPSGKAKSGRVNPLGISYFYAASDLDTAISEIRPDKGEVVSVAKFQLDTSVKIADLRDPKHTISPFELEEDNLTVLHKEMPYLIVLSEELTKPIVPSEADLEYLPSQYLCEFFKSIGYTGIVYRSSLSKGENYALFNDACVHAIEVKEYLIQGGNVSFKEIR